MQPLLKIKRGLWIQLLAHVNTTNTILGATKLKDWEENNKMKALKWFVLVLSLLTHVYFVQGNTVAVPYCRVGGLFLLSRSISNFLSPFIRYWKHAFYFVPSLIVYFCWCETLCDSASAYFNSCMLLTCGTFHCEIFAKLVTCKRALAKATLPEIPYSLAALKPVAQRHFPHQQEQLCGFPLPWLWPDRHTARRSHTEGHITLWIVSSWHVCGLHVRGSSLLHQHCCFGLFKKSHTHDYFDLIFLPWPDEKYLDSGLDLSQQEGSTLVQTPSWFGVFLCGVCVGFLQVFFPQSKV